MTTLEHEPLPTAQHPLPPRPVRLLRPPRPTPSPIRGFDVAWVIGLNLVVIDAMWIVHGGPDLLVGWAGWMTAVGQLAALYGTFATLAVLILIARVPWLERRYGMDQLNLWHRWAGFFSVTLLLLHAVATTLGYAGSAGIGLWPQIIDFFSNYPNVFASMVGLGVFLAVAITSAKVARRTLSYETWWFIHLYAYLAVALSFAHQFAVGTDFISDWWARAYWTVLYVLVAVMVLGYRFARPLMNGVRHRMRVVAIERETPGVATIVVSGRNLNRLAAESGQFFLLRFLRRDRWWKAMPLSLSAPPDGRSLRFTVKAAGDDTTAIQQIPIGTRVIAEGPYGTFTAARATRRKVLLVAGGIGITPLRALYEDLNRDPGDVTLLYRTTNQDEAVFLADLTRIGSERGFGIFVSYSRPRGRRAADDPFTPQRLRSVVPDVADHDVFVCGPPSMVAAASRALRQAGVPSSHIHLEQFAY